MREEPAGSPPAPAAVSAPKGRQLAVTSSAPRQLALWASRHRWALVILACSGLLVLLHLGGLATAPPGLYADEASIGYNAWAVAHFGVDEHAVHLPLYFQAFGDYKNPVYVYTVAALTRVLPLTPTVERLPAGLYGLLIALFIALAAWRLTRDRSVALVSGITAGLTPWVVVQSRVGFEAISMVAMLTIAVYCLVRGLAGRAGWWFACGVALAISILAYSTGRLFGGEITVVLIVAVGLTEWRRLWARLVLLALPVVTMYVLLFLWSTQHPGALLARYNTIGIAYDNPSLVTLADRFVGNYIQYLSVPFLFTHGDSNLRQNIGFGGMLAIATAPALFVGLAICLRRLREPLPRFLVLGLLAAPVPAALTANGTPHALRANAMLPFLLLLMALGWGTLLPTLARHRTWAALLAAFTALELSGFLFTLFVVWPAQSLAWFDAGEGPAIVRAYHLAHGREVLLSDTLDQPYIQALFWLRPNPMRFARDGLAVLHMAVVPPTSLAADAVPGALMVLAPSDVPPPGSRLVGEESVMVTATTYEAGFPARQRVELALIYRRIGA